MNILNSKTFRVYLGNFLILLSLAILVFTYYPVAMLYIPRPEAVLNSSIPEGFHIQIPKINAYSPVIENVDPFNENEYRKALENGVASARGFAKPEDQTGKMFIFAHSSDAPWRITRYNTIFFRLGELQNNDEIRLFKDGKEYKYKVVDKKEVWPNQVDVILNSQNRLILQTCTPVGTSLKRLLVFADPI